MKKVFIIIYTITILFLNFAVAELPKRVTLTGSVLSYNKKFVVLKTKKEKIKLPRHYFQPKKILRRKGKITVRNVLMADIFKYN